MEHRHPKSYLFKKLFIPFTFILSLCCIVYSCKKTTQNSVDTNDVSLLQAKTWYENAYPLSANKKLLATGESSKGDFSKIISPDWSKALSYNRFNTDVLELPLDSAVKLGFTTRNVSAGGFDINQSYSKSSFLITGSQGNYHAYIITFVADSSYLQNDFSKLSQLSYRKIDPAFSGLLLYFTPQGTLVNGWRYTNGHITKAIKSSGGQSGSLQVQSTGGLKVATLENGCTTSYLYVYTGTSCIGAGGTEYCTYYYDLYIYTICDIMGHNPDPGDGGGPPADGGSGTTTTVTPVTIVDDPCAGKTSAATTLNNILNNNTSISNAITATIGYANSSTPSEAFYNIELNNGVYTATTPQVNSPGQPMSSGTIDANTIGTGHGHGLGSIAVPSAWDLYQAGTDNQNHPNVIINLINSPTDNYAVIVNSSTDFANFSSLYSRNVVVDPTTNDFNENYEMGRTIKQVGNDAYNNYYVLHGINSATATPAQDAAAEMAGYEAGILYFLSNYKTGIILLKKDNTTGTYKPLHNEATLQSNGTVIYTPSPCNN